MNIDVPTFIIYYRWDFYGIFNTTLSKSCISLSNT